MKVFGRWDVVFLLASGWRLFCVLSVSLNHLCLVLLVSVPLVGHIIFISLCGAVADFYGHSHEH